ncbi:iduronate 2-sulfatase-like [Mercenaria mercenaria]|uniref:iduronate 2-sulfatase-like n=1 Tax=Mercenaria mercenaria TaxID=6596 RepID=UPI00234E990A|nr:iduronate 2-sulfatase-like [Mercenaria mercenaria]
MASSWKAVPDNILSDKPLRDQQVADQAMKALQRLAPEAKSGKKPFFLAAGFYKPHLPFIFPESVLNFYPKKSIRLPKNPHIPLNMPKIAWSSYTFLRKHPDIKDLNITGEFNTTLPKFKMLELRRAYYSAVTFIDFQIGRVLMEVDRLGLSSNTVVVFWSDHGFHLGENGEWCKNTAFEMSTWAPLMFHIPGVTDHGIESVQLAEFVDLYPTLLEAVGHRPPPICPQNSRKINFCVEGVSVLSLIDQPNKPIKTAVFSQVARPNRTMAYIVRTKNYRYTEYVHYNYATGKINWQTKAVELYDLSKDPFENINVAGFKKYGHVIAELRVKLKLGWRKSLLPNSSRNESRPMDKIISDQTTDVKSNDETRDVLSNDKTKDVLSNDKTMDVLSNDKTKDVLSNDKTMDVLSNDKTKDVLSNDKTMDVLSNDKTRETNFDEAQSDGPGEESLSS